MLGKPAVGFAGHNTRCPQDRPQAQGRPSARESQPGMGAVVGAALTDRTSPWLIRDGAGWGAGTLFTASADLLVAWHTASSTTHRRAATSSTRRIRPLIDEVRRARLAAELDA